MSGQVAFRLIREVYGWFGIEDNKIPYKEQIDAHFATTAKQIPKAGL